MRDFFENRYKLNPDVVGCSKYFKNSDVGEVFIEHASTTSLVLQNGAMRTCSSAERAGFGVRRVSGAQTAYISSSDVSTESIKKALESLHKFDTTQSAAMPRSDISPHDLYPSDVNYHLAEAIDIMHSIEAYLRRNPHVAQTTISLSFGVQRVMILLPDGEVLSDDRPLVRLNVSVVVEKGGRTEMGSDGFGGRIDMLRIRNAGTTVAKRALDQALINTEAVDAPTGEMPVVLSPGWTGVILHEAVGHGLEADFNRKGVSAFSDLMGEPVASEKVTIIDDGTVKEKRGSLNFDDEGTVTQKNILIENGILKSYMCDKQNAALMGLRSTGNGRRESFMFAPCPRMTNTYMLGGSDTRAQMIQSVDRGIYAVSFSGGQVDIVSGKFVFSASEAYLIENGRVTNPVKGVSLIGDGPSILKRVSMVGNDFALDPGVGTCGKDGQMVPVSVGEPSIKVDSITVGGRM